MSGFIADVARGALKGVHRDDKRKWTEVEAEEDNYHIN
jgi:hypothetical protein